MQKYIKDEKHNFKPSHFKGELFFLKYTLDQKSNNYRQKFLSELDNATLETNENKDSKQHDQTKEEQDMTT